MQLAPRSVNRQSAEAAEDEVLRSGGEGRFILQASRPSESSESYLSERGPRAP